jgi:hypothetical protein
LSVNDQSAGVATGWPLSQSPGALHAKVEALTQFFGSKPVKRSTTSSTIKQTTIAPAILRTFNGHLRKALDGRV